MSDCCECGSNMNYQKIVPYKEWKMALKDFNNVLSIEKDGYSERIKELTSEISAEKDSIIKKVLRQELGDYKKRLAHVKSKLSENDYNLKQGAESKDGTIFMMDDFGNFNRWLLGPTLKNRYELSTKESDVAYS